MYADLKASKFFEARECDDPAKGRGLFAKRAIKAGTTLVRASPAVSILDLANLAGHCSHCGKSETQTQLKTCSACKAIRFCSTACQKSAWTAAEHKLECAAIQRWSKQDLSSGHSETPETPVRAIGRLLFAKSANPETGWWRDIDQLQSHRSNLSKDQLEYFARLSMTVALYVGEEVAKCVGSGSQLLDLCCSFATNSFSLTLPDLTPIGVAVCPVVALANHSCWPNSVVVYPRGPFEAQAMHIVAISDIAEGEEIMTSYIDLSLPRQIRQKDLRDRYYFDCRCDLCQGTLGAVDPREALVCQTRDCPDTGQCCAVCKKTSQVEHKTLEEYARAMAERLAILQGAHKQGVDASALARSLDGNQIKKWQSVFSPSSHPFYAILLGYQLLMIDSGKFDVALTLSMLVTKGMSLLYPSNHPVPAIQLLTFVKLSENVGISQGTFRSTFAALSTAVAKLSLAFGKESVVLTEAKQMLADFEGSARQMSMSM